MKKIWINKTNSFKDAKRFDVKFWADAGTSAKFSAMWTLVKEFYRIRNKHGYKPRLQRSVQKLKQISKDLDIWIDANVENAEKLYKALNRFGAPLKNVAIKYFTRKKNIYQIGVAPVRIDIMMGLPGLKFDRAWKNRKKSKYGGVFVNIIGIKELIYSKRKAKRPQDILDIKDLNSKRKTSLKI